jgi:NhaP-type Na+/H+ or K+/H+ antiporter
VLLGGALARGALAPLGWEGAAVALALVLVVRPVAGWTGLHGSGPSVQDRVVIAAIGIRGKGSVYYHAHAVNVTDFAEADRLWAITLATIVVSIVLHGATSGAALWRADVARVEAST